MRSALSNSNFCKRFNSKLFSVNRPALSLDRARDAGVLKIVGLDMADPLYLKSGVKSWICLFTCAIFRAVHLELVTSMSTHKFIKTCRRFIA